MNSEFDGSWNELSREAMKPIKHWRLSHPKATWNEIEPALAEPLGRFRARTLAELAPASEARHWDEQRAERPRCPQGHEELIGRGPHVRELETNPPQRWRLDRTEASCPRGGGGLFPPGCRVGMVAWEADAALAAIGGPAGSVEAVREGGWRGGGFTGRGAVRAAPQATDG